MKPLLLGIVVKEDSQEVTMTYDQLAQAIQSAYLHGFADGRVKEILAREALQVDDLGNIVFNGEYVGNVEDQPEEMAEEQQQVSDDGTITM